MEYPKRKCIKSVIITGLVLAVSFALGGCGEKSAADAETETAAIAATETEYTMPTEKEAAVAETEVATETEEPVLFRVKVTSENGAYISEKPTDFAYGEIMLYDYGTEFNVYEVYENSEEDSIYYRVKNESGENKYIWDGDVTVID